MEDVTKRKNEHGIPSGAAKKKNTATMTNDAQAENPEMDQKLKRTISNRFAARRCRMKKLAYMADLERKVESLQQKIPLLIPQIKVEQTRCQSLQIEQHMLKFRMAVCEKHRIIQEVEIEKKRAEVNWLRQQLKLAIEAKSKLNRDHLNLTLGVNGEGTSKGGIDNVHQPQTLSQMGIEKLNNKPIIPDLNLLPEPDSEFEQEY